jgi:hypothetical protein
MTVAAEKAQQMKIAELEAAQEFKEGQTLLDVNAQTSRQYFDVQTGKPLPQTTKVSQAKTLISGGAVVFLDDEQAKQYRNVQRMVPLLGQIRTAVENVWGPGGIFENLSPAERAQAAVAGGFSRLTQSNPKLAQATRLIAGNVDNLRRSLQGQVGTQTEQDALRGLQVLPQPGGIPDSQEVAYGMYNTLLETTNAMLGDYLGNPAFQESRLRPLENIQQKLLEKYRR